MSYPKQVSVADRLQTEALDELDRMKEKGWSQVTRLWRRTRTDLRGLILDTYHTHFPNQKWSVLGLKTTGAQSILHHGIHDRLDAFKHQSFAIAKTHLNEIYKRSILRHAWVIDQTTPPNIKVRIPYRMKLIEAQINYFSGQQATRELQTRWGMWSDSYANALETNLQMGALNASSAQDAADEVDATTINTPRSTLIDALERQYGFEATYGVNQGIAEVANMNEEADVVEIWETRRNLSVCEVCENNEGLTEEEVNDEIPAHPNCRCYWRIVPAAWAKLLRSGDENDYATAIQMDSAGLVPTAMAITDESGKLGGYTTVDFGPWLKDNFFAVSGQ